MDREIKVTKCGRKEDCNYNDRICIEFNPYELEVLRLLSEQSARYGIFRKAHEIWEKEREGKDK